MSSMEDLWVLYGPGHNKENVYKPILRYYILFVYVLYFQLRATFHLVVSETTVILDITKR